MVEEGNDVGQWNDWKDRIDNMPDRQLWGLSEFESPALKPDINLDTVKILVGSKDNSLYPTHLETLYSNVNPKENLRMSGPKRMYLRRKAVIPFIRQMLLVKWWQFCSYKGKTHNPIKCLWPTNDVSSVMGCAYTAIEVDEDHQNQLYNWVKTNQQKSMYTIEKKLSQKTCTTSCFFARNVWNPDLSHECCSSQVLKE